MPSELVYRRNGPLVVPARSHRPPLRDRVYKPRTRRTQPRAYSPRVVAREFKWQLCTRMEPRGKQLLSGEIDLLRGTAQLIILTSPFCKPFANQRAGTEGDYKV